MNKNSKICCFINDNKDDWKEKLVNEYDIKVKEEYPYVIFNYGIKSVFSDPIVQEARGIIIDIRTLDVVCWPFRKFGNYNESYADKIDWSTARVQEKIDGSIIKMWYDKECHEWFFSTNSTIYAKDALANTMTKKSFMDIIRETDNIPVLKKAEMKGKLNKNNTYIFELVSPETQVIVRYEKPYLYHIGTRDNITGEEYNKYIGIEQPRGYSLRSLDDCVNAAFKLNENENENGTVNSVKKEGFVVVDNHWNRIKIKSPDYLMLHRLSSNSSFSKKRIVQLIRHEGTEILSIPEMCNNFPDLAHYFKYYDFKISEFEYKAKVFIDFTRKFYEEHSRDRKLVAEMIKKHNFAPLGFASLDQPNKSSKEILEELELNKYIKYIPDYIPETLISIFYPGKNI
ncbi:MAG: putative RNA ligase A [Caudoviricetes sp.]|nr:MAG: putative RNA ligase A [Caudoviricetes sp.]